MNLREKTVDQLAKMARRFDHRSKFMNSHSKKNDWHAQLKWPLPPRELIEREMRRRIGHVCQTT